MKRLILIGLLAVPAALVACQSDSETRQEVVDGSVVALNVTGMT